MSIDTLRLHYPGFGFAVYAYQAGEPVTVEAHTPTGEMFTASGPTEHEAWVQLFPGLAQQEAETTHTEEQADEHDAPDSIFD